MTENQSLLLAKKIIKTNINDPLEFHVDNFINNKIIYNRSEIRKIVYSMREEKYQNDNEFLNDIGNIIIELLMKIKSNKFFVV